MKTPMMVHLCDVPERERAITVYNTEKWPTLPLTNIAVRPRTYYAIVFWILVVVSEFLIGEWYNPLAWQIAGLCDLGALAGVSFVMWVAAVDNDNR